MLSRRMLLTQIAALGAPKRGAIDQVVQQIEDVPHLLGRIGYGIAPRELALAESMGFEAWVDYQLDYEAIDDSELEAGLLESYSTLSMSAQELAEVSRSNDRGPRPEVELLAATLIRRIFSPRQLFERMVEFWGDHFSVFLFDGPVSYFKTLEDRSVMRVHALGSFADLLHADARSPAMLYYLDNFSNTVVGPNENYARELLELHTLGVDGGYSETDVKEVARCFTGWTISERSEEVFTFAPELHDAGSKQVLGESIPAGGGIEDGERVLDILAAHPSTALFLSEKLCRRFVSDAPPPSLVDAVAQRFDETGGDIRETLRTVLLSAEFRAAKGAKYKRPADMLISMLRATDPFLAPGFGRLMFELIISLGHAPFTWTTPDGFPDDQQAWLSTSAQLSRWNFGLGVADGTHRNAVQLKIFELLGPARTPEAIVDRLVEVILFRTIDETDRERLIAFVAQGAPQDERLPLITAVRRARALVGILFGSRYFQYS